MNKKWFSVCITFCLILLSVENLQAQQQSAPPLPHKDFTGQPSYKVLRVVDGDTLVLSMDGKDTKVRLIGVDTPETVHPSKPVQAYGKEASQFLHNLLDGKSVYVEYEPGPSKLDKYGRLLAYLYRVPDGLFVNLEIIRQGYGHAYTQYPFQYMELFRSCERIARESGKGLWGKSEGATTDQEKQGETVYVTRSGTCYHRAGCRSLSKSQIPISLGQAKKKYKPCSVCNPP